MKKTLIIFIFFISLFLGMQISKPSDASIEEKLKDFENSIINPNNEYNSNKEKIDPNIFSSIGKKVESVIDEAFDFAFGMIKKIID